MTTDKVNDAIRAIDHARKMIEGKHVMAWKWLNEAVAILEGEHDDR